MPRALNQWISGNVNKVKAFLIRAPWLKLEKSNEVVTTEDHKVIVLEPGNWDGREQ